MWAQRQQSWVFYAMPVMEESSGAKPMGPDAQAILWEFFFGGLARAAW
jgi:hypothetical protein